MQYIRADNGEEGVLGLTEHIARELRSGKRILWLVCGGSNISLIIRAMDSIPAELMHALTITLVDERYGPVGHADSNWQQLIEAGFKTGQAKTLPVLEDGKSLAETAEKYAAMIEQAVHTNDVVIGVFGIGADGHVAGILPDSPAANEEKAWAIGYEAAPFRRLTLTFPALKNVDTAYAFAFGEAKHAALHQLQTETVPLTEQPAQILKQLPKAYVYSDQIEKLEEES